MSVTISRAVGRVPSNVRDANLSVDVVAVQKLLNAHKKKQGVTSLLREDGRIGPNTIRAIEEFQRHVVRMSSPDGRVDPGGATLRKLNDVGTTTNSSNNSQCCFPFSSLPSQSWTTGARAFGSNRSNGTRAHAGCDLYFPSGTAIHAVADGTVIAGPYAFYAQTYAIEVDHGSFIVRYGEVQSSTNVSVGMSVTKGQKIAKVGHLVGISVPSDMLHLEMYSKSAGGALTVTSAASSKKRSDGIPFFRRSDLIDPTPFLNQWKNNLPTT